jgi:hypothetical protein
LVSEPSAAVTTARPGAAHGTDGGDVAAEVDEVVGRGDGAHLALHGGPPVATTFTGRGQGGDAAAGLAVDLGEVPADVDARAVGDA